MNRDTKIAEFIRSVLKEDLIVEGPETTADNGRFWAGRATIKHPEYGLIEVRVSGRWPEVSQ